MGTYDGTQLAAGHEDNVVIIRDLASFMLRFLKPWRQLYKAPRVHDPPNHFRTLLQTTSIIPSHYSNLGLLSRRLNSTMTVQSKPSETFGNFDLVTRTKLDFTNLEVSKWKSRETGLSVVHLDYEGVSSIHVATCNAVVSQRKMLTKECSSNRRWVLCCGHGK